MGPCASSTTTHHHRRFEGARGRVAVIAVAALAAAGSLAACGAAAPSQSALAAKLKTDTNFQGANVAQLNCIAGILIKHGNPTSLNQYIAGKISDGQVKGSDSADVKKQAMACATKYQNG